MEYVTEQLALPPVVTSAPLAWRGLRIEQIHLEAGALPAHYQEQHLLMLYQVDQPYRVQHRTGRQLREHVYQTGDLGLYPRGDCNTDLTWQTASDNLYLTLDDHYLAQLVGQDQYYTQVALAEQLKFQDPLLRQLSRQLLVAAGSEHAMGRLYVESLTNALCYQLLEHHAQPRRQSKGELQLSQLALARIDAYLETQVEAAVTLAELAGLANLSVFHFARLFKQATGLPPYQYVLRWKIKRAQQQLRCDAASVAELSDALGFASPISFAAAFKRVVGCTPRQYQQR
jgi:AraC family transcriptional regulator